MAEENYGTQRKDNLSPGGAGRSAKAGENAVLIKTRRHFAFIVIMMITPTISVMLVRSSSKPESVQEEQTAVFGIKSIVVEGSAHYSDDQIPRPGAVCRTKPVFCQ